MKVFRGLTEIVLQVNGEDRRVGVQPGETLLHTVRDGLGLTGTKRGCENGDCGACTVQIEGVPVKSCYTLTVDVEGRAITTIEGLQGSVAREAFEQEEGFQCGYCTSGFIVNADAFLRRPGGRAATRGDRGGAGDLRERHIWLQSNICRCTGYETIERALDRCEGGEKT
ncbi:(2Fe-2S)-binding protein [Alkalispirochaeta sphaeroplastigenens]|uniref:(2Fe-2S)-binding protein n=1 Tax=Alkalispirochaeta sphaeroplastigenens TaxID=1187066 RepID=A0A2S4JRX5_9SPIO|nr:2Fe-2S iron-sulfur cluster-binding protein [Alkalispirochaeta sphaeroplastigenens]POR02289.1 (2Fe-2S)-binding protein [Alkalispirochaeta sphaeroplastigenens]